MVFDLIYEPSKAKTSVRISNSKRVKQSGDETSARADRGKVGGEMVTILIGVEGLMTVLMEVVGVIAVYGAQIGVEVKELGELMQVVKF